MGLTFSYVVRRFLLFLFIIWLTATINFMVVHMAPGDPTAGMLSRMSQQGASIRGSAQIVAQYRKTFGLDQPLPIQYVTYLAQTSHLEFGYSLTHFPDRVIDIIANALPWTLGLLFTSTVISFILGTILGALMIWRAAPRLLQVLLPPLMILAAIPYYLLALLLLYLLAFSLGWFPVGAAVNITSTGGLNLGSILDVMYHSFLPALSIVLSAVGSWMLGMRAMMVTVMGTDYLTLAEAKGLSQRRIFVWYAMRNAILPQVTSLAIALGYVVSGAVLVEVIYSYPGIGNLLYQAITNVDYPLILGISLILVIAVALAIFVLDLLYPRIDPRITYQER